MQGGVNHIIPNGCDLAAGVGDDPFDPVGGPRERVQRTIVQCIDFIFARIGPGIQGNKA